MDEGNWAVGFACPACGEFWSYDDRVKANLDSVLLHDGQTITAEGAIEGEFPATDTLGFRTPSTTAEITRNRRSLPEDASGPAALVVGAAITPLRRARHNGVGGS